MIRLVARREFTERLRERSFLISTGAHARDHRVVVVLPAVLGFGDPSEYRISADAASRPSPSARPCSTSASTRW